MNNYEFKIVSALLKKYYKRQIGHKDNQINRRIDLPISKVLRKYSDFNVDLTEKDLVNCAVNCLKEKGFITVSYLKLSDDVEKIYLNIDNVHDLEIYALNKFNITPRSFAINEINTLIKKYSGKGEITDYYICELKKNIDNSLMELDVRKEEDLLKALSFLQVNDKYLYLREMSMLVYGDSKYLENNRKSQINTILYNYLNSINRQVDTEDNTFKNFNIYDTDQEMCIKGSVIIEFENNCINIEGLDGGVSFSIKDLNKIKAIHIHSAKVFTIENKTSFLRMKSQDCSIYLGGFANKAQIAFIKKLIKDNPEVKYYHFGDIDAGGFLIHKNLCEQTATEFILFHMGIDELCNLDYKSCLKELTLTDIHKLTNLKQDYRYHDCVDYMLKNNVKLEQEIISLNLYKE